MTFDLWQTLLLDNRELGLARAMVRLEGAQRALAQFGEEYNLEHIREAYRACYRHCRSVREGEVDVSFQEQVEVFVNNVSPGLTERLPGDTLAEIVRVYADSFLVYPPVLHTETRRVLRTLKDMDLRLGLISNTGMTPGSTFRAYLETEGVLGYFEELTFSDEVRLAKPSTEMFLMTLRSLGVDPGQAIHVGDHVVNDVVGGKRSGMKTIWVEGYYEREDPEDLESEPDASVSDLGHVVEAVAGLSGRRIPDIGS